MLKDDRLEATHIFDHMNCDMFKSLSSQSPDRKTIDHITFEWTQNEWIFFESQVFFIFVWRNFMLFQLFSKKN